MTPRVRLSSIAGGVVSVAGAISTPSSTTIVPMSPHGTPAAIIIRWIIHATVVLPLVPVTPMSVRSRDGQPKNRSATTAVARGASSATTQVTPDTGSIGSWSLSTATAPASAASAA